VQKQHEGLTVELGGFQSLEKCLITGGAGFIGSHLVEACLEKGYQVVVLDDLTTGKMENLPLEPAGLEFVKGSINDRALLLALKEKHPDISFLFHLAAIASVVRSMENPIATHEVNFQGTLLLLEVFKGSRLKKFVYASSAAVYGNTSVVPVGESACPDPLSPYGADKLQGEHYLRIFNDAFQVPTVACRFFNVFGERQDPSSPYSGVISIFFDRTVAKRKGKESALTIFGDGKQSRDFIYVRDVVRAWLHLAEEPSIRGQVYNIGYGKRTTILELADKVKNLIGVPMDVIFEKERKGDALHSEASIDKLKSTGFEFSYDLDDGLKRLGRFLTEGDDQGDTE
jgi:UDP-glucose 4-epimerase